MTALFLIATRGQWNYMLNVPLSFLSDMSECVLLKDMSLKTWYMDFSKLFELLFDIQQKNKISNIKPNNQ